MTRLDRMSDEAIIAELNTIRQVETNNNYEKALFAETLIRILINLKTKLENIKNIDKDFCDWLRGQAIGYDIWDRKDEKLYALPVWLAIKEDQYQKSVTKGD